MTNAQRWWPWILALVLVGLACGCVGLAAGGLVGYLIGRGSGSVPSAIPWWGVEVRHETDGVRILQALPNSPPGEASLRPDGRPTAVDGEPVDAAPPLPDAIQGHRPGEAVRQTVVRDGETRPIMATLSRAPQDTSR